MNPRIRILLAFGLLLIFSLLIWKPVITGKVSTETPQQVVVILKTQTNSRITGSATLEEETPTLVELKESTEEARQEVLEDVNSPTLVENMLGIESEPDVKEERIMEIVPAMVVEATAEGIEELKNHPLVEAVYPNLLFELQLDQSVPLINADDAWAIQVNDKNIDGQGTSVCVIDTGIDANHEAFQNRIADQKCFCSPDCCPNGQATDTAATDVHPSSHGTHVSGIIAANGQYKGVAPGASIVAVKVCNTGCSLADVYAGLDYCLQVKDTFNIVAISGSLGDNGNYQTQEQCPTYLDAAIDAAFNAGVVNVFASGNNGYTNGISYPACSPNVIAVGATDKNDAMASFTNRGQLLEVLAPGVSITSTQAGNQYGALSGTSQATPHVTGAAALLMQYAQESGMMLTPNDVKNALMSTGLTIQSGYPRINVLAALQSLGANQTNQSNSAPVPSISSPLANSTVSNPVLLLGNATDVEDGTIPNQSMEWSENSTIFGNGSRLEINLTEGSHTVNLTATDSNGANGTATVSFTIESTSQISILPTITTTSQTLLGQGAYTTLTITGTNFESGSNATFNDSDIKVLSANVTNSTEINATIYVALNTTQGNAALIVNNSAGNANYNITIVQGPLNMSSITVNYSSNITGVPVFFNVSIQTSPGVVKSMLNFSNSYLIIGNSTKISANVSLPNVTDPPEYFYFTGYGVFTLSGYWDENELYTTVTQTPPCTGACEKEQEGYYYFTIYNGAGPCVFTPCVGGTFDVGDSVMETLTLVGLGCVPPVVSCSVILGSLPPGLILSILLPLSCTITGTLTTAGSFASTISGIDSAIPPNEGLTTCEYTVNAPPPPSSGGGSPKMKYVAACCTSKEFELGGEKRELTCCGDTSSEYSKTRQWCENPLTAFTNGQLISEARHCTVKTLLAQLTPQQFEAPKYETTPPEQIPTSGEEASEPTAAPPVQEKEEPALAGQAGSISAESGGDIVDWMISGIIVILIGGAAGLYLAIRQKPEKPVQPKQQVKELIVKTPPKIQPKVETPKPVKQPAKIAEPTLPKTTITRPEPPRDNYEEIIRKRLEKMTKSRKK